MAKKTSVEKANERKRLDLTIVYAIGILAICVVVKYYLEQIGLWNIASSVVVLLGFVAVIVAMYTPKPGR